MVSVLPANLQNSTPAARMYAYTDKFKKLRTYLVHDPARRPHHPVLDHLAVDAHREAVHGPRGAVHPQRRAEGKHGGDLGDKIMFLRGGERAGLGRTCFFAVPISLATSRLM